MQKDEVNFRSAFVILIIIIIMISANLMYVNFLLYKNIQPNSTIKKIATPNTVINQLKPTSINTISPTEAVLTVLSDQPLIQHNSGVKDYFIPLGSGSNQTSDWSDVPGVQATIDFSQYNSINNVYFESSVYVPTANESVSVRLFNETDHHPVWYSEVTMKGNASAFLTSPAIIIDPGMKLYQVQMKTQLQFQANLVQSRIHVVLN